MSRRRSGHTLIEVTVAGGLLAVAMSTAAQVHGWMAVGRRVAEYRACALTEAANALERIAAEPQQLSIETPAPSLELSPAALQFLPDGEIRCQVTPADELTSDDGEAAISGFRIEVTVRWRARAGAATAPVSLTTWVYHRVLTE